MDTGSENNTHLGGIKRIAVIGAGPTGVACAKYFVAEKCFATIDIFEQRDNVGGVWNLSSPINSKRIPIPQINPNLGAYRHGMTQDELSLEFESPLYDYLETNIPKPLMAYSDFPFGNELPLFPKHDQVLKYLEEYAKSVTHLIRFKHQVIGLSKKISPASSNVDTWVLTARDLTTEQCTTAEYEAVVIANGHYTVPHVPAIPGLHEWDVKYPGIVIHSKAYRRPKDFKDQKVLVIGNSASGMDIAAQVSSFASHPVYLASRSASVFATDGCGPSWRADISEVVEFVTDSGERRVRTRDGQVIDALDAVIFATGYFYSYPFLDDDLPSYSTSLINSRTPSPTSTDPELPVSHMLPTDKSSDKDTRQSDHCPSLTTTGLRTHDMYKHFLHIDHPTLAIPVLNLKVIPFPLAQNQAAILARLWAGRLPLPQRTAMRQWEAEEEQRLLDADRTRPVPEYLATSSYEKCEVGFHNLVYPEDVAQINDLYHWALQAQPRPDLENEGRGKLGAYRNEESTWLRSRFADIKAAYAKHGEMRDQVTSLDMLGENWKNAYRKWCAKTDQGERENLFRQARVPGFV